MYRNIQTNMQDKLKKSRQLATVTEDYPAEPTFLHDITNHIVNIKNKRKAHRLFQLQEVKALILFCSPTTNGLDFTKHPESTSTLNVAAELHITFLLHLLKQELFTKQFI